jgi:hypothetical protein
MGQCSVSRVEEPRGCGSFYEPLREGCSFQELSVVYGSVDSCQRSERLQYLARCIFIPDTINRSDSYCRAKCSIEAKFPFYVLKYGNCLLLFCVSSLSLVAQRLFLFRVLRVHVCKSVYLEFESYRRNRPWGL